MATRYTPAQAVVVDSDNRNMATGTQGVLPMSAEINDIWETIDAGTIGITSQATDIDAIAGGGGEFTWNASSPNGLSFAYNAGRYYNGYQMVNVSAGTLTLVGSATNYIELDRSLGVVSNTTGFTAGRAPLMTVATGVDSITTADNQLANSRCLLCLLGPQSVNGKMLSAVQALHSIEKNVASISATLAFIFIMPSGGTIAAVTISNEAAISTSNTNNWAFQLANKTQTLNVLDTGADNGTAATGGSALAAYTARTLVLNSTSDNQNFNANDVMEFTATMTGSPTALSEFAVRVDWISDN